jgi:hypothetical protein
MLKILMHLFAVIILINNATHIMGMKTTVESENYFKKLKLINSVQTEEAKSILTDSMFQQHLTPELKRLSIANHIGDILALSPIIRDPKHSCHMHAYKCIQTLLAASEFYGQDAIGPVQKLIIKTIEEQNAPLMKLLFSAKSPLLNHPFTRFLDRDQNTALHLCIQHNFPNGIASICAHSNLKYLEDTNSAGDTPLVHALKMNKPECVKALVNNHCIVDQSASDLAKAHCDAIVPFLNNAQQPVIQELPREVLKKIWGLSAVGQDITSRIKSIDFSCISKQFLDCKVFSYPLDAYPVISSIDLALAPLDCKGVKEVLWKILNKPWHQLNEAQQRKARNIIILHRSAELMNTGLDRNWMRGEGPTLLEYALRDKEIDLTFVQFLVENGARINKKSINTDSYINLTPLEYLILHLKTAARRRSPGKWYDTLACIHYFLQQEGTVNELIETSENSAIQDKKLPILCIAILEGCSDIALKIILRQKNININIVANYIDTSQTPLTTAVHGHIKHMYNTDYYFSTINLLLDTPGIDVNQKTNDNQTAFTVVENTAPELLSQDEKRGVTSLLNAKRHFSEPVSIDDIIKNMLDAFNEPAPAPNIIPAHQQGLPGVLQVAPVNHQAIGAAPAPVPGDNQASVNMYFFGKNPLYWIAGISLCAATAYVLHKYWWVKDKDDEVGEDIQEIDPSHCQHHSVHPELVEG